MTYPLPGTFVNDSITVPVSAGNLNELTAAIVGLDSRTSSLEHIATSPTSVKTAAYAAVSGDFVPVDTTSGTVAVTLPAAPPSKTRIGVKMVLGTTPTPNVVSIVASGSDVFNKAGGSTTLSLTTLNQAMDLVYGGGIWYVVVDSLSLAQLNTLFVSPADLTTETSRATTAEAVLTTKFTSALGVVLYSGGWSTRPTGFGSVEWRGPSSTPPYVFRTFTGATISSGTAITATAAAFTAADVGAPITGPGIGGTVTIASVTDSTHAVLSAASTNASGLTVVIAPNGMQENDTADLV